MDENRPGHRVLSPTALSGVFILFFGILLLLGLPEWPVHEFVLDDWLHISLYQQHAWWEISAYSWTHALPSGAYRPVFMTLFSGWLKLTAYHPLAFRLLATGLLAFNLSLGVRLLVRLGIQAPVACAAGLVWLLHPVHIETTHQASIADHLAGMTFLLLSLDAWLDCLQGRRRWTRSVAWFFLAVGCIESVMFLVPGFWLLGRKRQGRATAFVPLATMAAISIAVIGLRYGLRALSSVNPANGYDLVLGDNVLHNARQAFHQLFAFWPSAHVQWFSGLPFDGGQARLMATPLSLGGWAPLMALPFAAGLSFMLGSDRDRVPDNAVRRPALLPLGLVMAPLAFLPFLLLSNQVSIGNRYFHIITPGVLILLALLLEGLLRLPRIGRPLAAILVSTACALMAWHQLCSEKLNWRPAMLAQRELETQARQELAAHAGRLAGINLAGFPHTFGEALAVYPDWGWQGFLQSRIPGSRRWTGFLDATPEQLEAFVANHPLDPLVTLAWKGTDAP